MNHKKSIGSEDIKKFSYGRRGAKEAGNLGESSASQSCVNPFSEAV
jgi:hypothetical protein